MKPVNRTIHSFLRELAQTAPEKKLLGQMGLWLSAGEVLERTEAIAGELRRLGIHPGTRVRVETRRSTECALVLLALQAMGALAVLTDAREVHRDPEIPADTFLTLQGSRVSAPAGCFDVFTLPACPMEPLPLDARAPGFLIFTSGSTGKSKAVMVSQYNLVNNLLDSQPLGDYRPDDLALGALPMNHVFGLVLLCGTAVLGYGLYFPARTDVDTLLRDIQREGLTRMNGVPSLYLAMGEQAGDYDLRSLRVGFLGGSGWTAEQFRRMEGRLSMTLIPVYGMSECIGIACASYLDPQERRQTGVGPFYSMNEGVLLLTDGTQAAPGQVGEICVRGPARMVGYYPQRMPEAEFFPTGDLGYVDEDGILHLTGRIKDIIIRKGCNLSPRRMEEAMLSVPGVREAAVVGLPEELAGEVPGAMVVCTDAAEGRLRERLPRLLSKIEQPVLLLRVEALPKTATGKPDKMRIREVLLQCRA